MAYLLPSERVPLDLDGPSVEVERIRAWPIQQAGIGLYATVDQAKAADARLAALAALYRFVVAEAQPSWDIADHRGPVPVSDVGMLRLPLSLGLSISLEWLGTFGDKATAVDEVIAPGPARDELNRRLKAAKAA